MSTALIVVDMQNDFCHPDGSLYSENSENAIPQINELINSFDTVYYTLDTHKENADEFEKWGEHCVLGEWGWLLHDDLSVDYDGEEVHKNTYDAFFDTKLNEWLHEEGVDTVVLCGTLVNVCVQETASSAALYGFDVKVAGDAVGYLNEEQRDAALEHIDFLYGDVVETEDLM